MSFTRFNDDPCRIKKQNQEVIDNLALRESLLQDKEDRFLLKTNETDASFLDNYLYLLFLVF